MSRTIAAIGLAGKRTPAALAAGLLFALLSLPAGAVTGQDAAILRDAFRAADNERYEEAVRIADRAKDRTGHAIMRWLQLASAGGGTFDEIAAFIRAHGDWPNMNQLRRQAERAMPIDMDETRVLDWFKQNPPVGIEGVMRYADTLLATGGTAAAVSLIRERWVAGGFGPDDEATFLAGYRGHLRTQDHLARFQRLLWDRQADAARRMLPLLGNGGYEALLDARFALYEADRAVDTIVDRVPASLQKDPGLLYDRVRYRRRRGDDDGALEILLNPPRDPGHEDPWWTERHIMTRRVIERGDYRLAYRVASAHRQEDGVSQAEAEFLAGWLALRFLDRPSDAFAHFHRLYRSVSAPISRARGAYWSGRAADAVGDRRQAQEWFRTASAYGTTFYGQLAARHVADGARPKAPAEPRVGGAEAAAFEKREPVKAARLIAQVMGRDYERLTVFLRRVSLDAKTPADHALAARLASELGRPDLAVAAAKDAAQNQVYLVESGYPTLSLGGSSPEPALVHAIIRQESTFNANVVSSAGARGLMQLMPATAQLVARQLGIKHTHSRLTSDPGYNVRLGSAYMADLLERFNGSYVLAVASYNAGPGRTRTWIEQFGDPRTDSIDVVDWIELIPISETRNYVQRVMEAMLVYRSRKDGARADLDLYKELRR